MRIYTYQRSKRTVERLLDRARRREARKINKALAYRQQQHLDLNLVRELYLSPVGGNA